MAFLSHLSVLITVACVAGLWQGLVVVAMGLALFYFTPRATADLRHTMLLALFACALVLPWVQLQKHPGGSAQHALQLAPWVAAVIAFFWVVALVIRGVQLYLAWRHLCTVRRDATPIEVLGITGMRGGRRRALLCSSRDVSSPSILGFGSPRLLLPDWMVPLLSEFELQQIALHECEHLRRGDDWINLLLQVAIVLSPLNPALLWLNSRIRVQRELAVDSAVVAKTSEPLSYASCLTRLAEQRRDQGRLRLALAAWERRSELAQRVHALLNRPSLWTRRQSGWVAGLALVGLLLVAGVVARSPQFVQVSWPPPAVQAIETPLSLSPSMGREGRMVPASFHFQDRSVAAVHKKRTRKAVDCSEGFSSYLGPAEPFRHEDIAHRLHALNELPGHTVHWQGRSVWTGRSHVRRMTITYHPPYVAVPVPNGWLLIEL